MPVYRGAVEDLLRARCARCHAGSAPAGGYRVDSYAGVVACTETGVPAASSGVTSPLLAVLSRESHRGLLSAEEEATLRDWLAAGAKSLRSGVHGDAFVDPRSPESHAVFLRQRDYRPMVDLSDPDACGRCHEGAPTRPTGIAFAAPGATPCNTCHTGPTGPLGCGTCHGKGERAYPPRDPCFSKRGATNDVHRAHVEPGASSSKGIACAACHPTPVLGGPGGAHVNRFVDVVLLEELSGAGAKFDAASKRCTVACHARGGARPEVAWTSADAKLGCGDCHGAPPVNHYRGRCTACHAEADATGTAISKPTLHGNGRVDLGDGSGACGACHGKGADPWPTTGAHAAHARPGSSRAVACETCHEVPAQGAKHPEAALGAAVRFSGLATRGGRRPSYDPATKTCAGTYCHEGAGARVPSPAWTSGAPAAACGACHGAPPPFPHTTSTACGASGCHADLVTPGGELTPAGRAVHADGTLQTSP